MVNLIQRRCERIIVHEEGSRHPIASASAGQDDGAILAPPQRAIEQSMLIRSHLWPQERRITMPTNRKRPITPEDVYLLRNVTDPQLSPDGRRVAYVVSQPDKESDGTHMSIYVATVDGRSPPQRFTQ